jgi:uncharacterized protein involved in oxidation of intracellular sulfur
MRVLCVVYSNDSETAWNAFRFANSALVYDDQVTVFLLGKGVEVVSASTLQYDIEEQMNIFRENGGELIGCGVCCDSRNDEMPFLKEQLHCEMGSMQQLYVLVAESDKVLTF